MSLTVAACSVQETVVPDLTGPSTMATDLAVQASPDTIFWDGASQSAITIDARGPDGQPIRGLSIRVDISQSGQNVDFGTLSARTVVTGDDGRARLIYTAPPPPIDAGDGAILTLRFTPATGDVRGSNAHQLDIRLVPRGVILPPNNPPQPVFAFSPTEPQTLQPVFFDASGTMDEGRACASNCSYTWSFGDGQSASGVNVQHQYQSAGTNSVTLRVTDNRGQSVQTSQTVAVTGGSALVAAFVFSPDDPTPGTDVFFNASASTVAPPRRIVSYEWDFGSGRTGSGVTASVRYTTPGTYNVTLTVTDDANRTDTETQAVTVGLTGTGLTATLRYSPTNPIVGREVIFDARDSRGPSPIVSYRFEIGDASGISIPSTDGVARYTFTTPGVYVVRVVVTDSGGRTASATQNVTVTSGSPVAALIVAPSSPQPGVPAVLNASASSSPLGLPLTYTFRVNGVQVGAADQQSPTQGFTFPAAGAYAVSVLVRDSEGRTATSTVTVTVAAP